MSSTPTPKIPNRPYFRCFSSGFFKLLMMAFGLVIWSGAAVAGQPRGMIIYQDGSRAKGYDAPIEYSKITSFGATFKLLLPNGQELPGLTKQIVADVDYTNPSEDQVAYMESLATKYLAAAPILKTRIAEMQVILFNKHGSRPAGMAAKGESKSKFIQDIVLAGKMYKNVVPKIIEDGALKFEHDDGKSSVSLSDLTLKTLKLLAETNNDLNNNNAYKAAVAKFVPEALTIKRVSYTGVRVWSKEADETILLTDSGLVRCNQADLLASQWAKLSAVADAAAPNQAPSATAFPKPRFSVEQIGALSAASTIYQRAGVADEFGMGDNFGVADQRNLRRKREKALEDCSDTRDDNIRNLVGMELGAIYANDALAEANQKEQTAILVFEILWSKRFNLQNILLDFAANNGRLRDVFTSSLRSAGKLLTPVQAAHTNTLNIMLLKSNLQKKARASGAAIAELRDEGRDDLGAAIKLVIKDDHGILWMQAINNSGRALHHCLVTARRIQKPFEVIAAKPLEHFAVPGLMMLYGFPSEALIVDAAAALSEIELVRAEHGSMVFVQDLAPGDSITFPLAPCHDIRYTRSVEASLWCDEGKTLDLQADLSSVVRRK